MTNQKLAEAEAVGLIEKALVNKEDYPYLTWKDRLPQYNNQLFLNSNFVRKIMK
jgi:hypothetical protein